ncbi:CIC11C00000005269 [Sungouiella intermedia]|uniref:Chromatin modification-related protein EAF6 n=1 Tax=Sungouiella intermedia TaxID=45354 RepID=A0A1L0FUA8_9ASCO|nr:CIC11C00000005269 [[Candida] intermedia]SGZ58178.1 CIC11C00000001172 [[Candida] intermedia]
MSKKEPTIDQYTQLKNELTKLILKKQELDAQLLALEEAIYDKENDYFNESTYGNIVKGFDNFAKSSSGGSNKRKMIYTDDDHIFSLSSSTFVKTLMKREGVNTGAPDLDDYEDSVDPVSGPTTAGTESNGGTPARKRKSRFEEK